MCEVRKDLTWAHLCQSAHPYYIAHGLSSKAGCRSCGYPFSKSELRIKTTILRKLPGSIRPCPTNVCTNLQCIKALTRRGRTAYQVLKDDVPDMRSKCHHLKEKFEFLVILQEECQILTWNGCMRVNGADAMLY